MPGEIETGALRIRRATRDDVSEIVRLLADDMLGRDRERFESPLPEAYYSAFAEIDDDRNQELIVGEIERAIVGTLQLSIITGISFLGSRRAVVEAVRVDAPFRGRGIGEALMRWAEGRARERGCRVLQLTTDKRRRDAHRFYERLGFEASHEGMKLPLS